jgi:hypothetical protein
MENEPLLQMSDINSEEVRGQIAALRAKVEARERGGNFSDVFPTERVRMLLDIAEAALAVEESTMARARIEAEGYRLSTPEYEHLDDVDVPLRVRRRLDLARSAWERHKALREALRALMALRVD